MFVRKQLIRVLDILVESDKGTNPRKHAKSLKDKVRIIRTIRNSIEIEFDPKGISNRYKQYEYRDYCIGDCKKTPDLVDKYQLVSRFEVCVLFKQHFCFKRCLYICHSNNPVAKVASYYKEEIIPK